MKNLKPQEPHAAFIEIHNAFSKFGKVCSIKLHIDQNGLSKDFAYILFNTKEAAESAKQNLHNTELNGLTIEVELYRKFTSKPVSGDMNALFIKGIPSDATEDELLEEFK